MFVSLCRGCAGWDVSTVGGAGELHAPLPCVVCWHSACTADLSWTSHISAAVYMSPCLLYSTDCTRTDTMWRTPLLHRPLCTVLACHCVRLLGVWVLEALLVLLALVGFLVAPVHCSVDGDDGEHGHGHGRNDQQANRVVAAMGITGRRQNHRTQHTQHRRRVERRRRRSRLVVACSVTLSVRCGQWSWGGVKL